MKAGRYNVAAKIRVHELAKELGLTNKECLDLCLALGIGVKTHSSGIDEAQADRVRRRAKRDGLTRDAQPEVQRDIGIALLQPITVDEYRATEQILSVLWSALDRKDLTEVQESQILAMADLIRAERRSTTPGQTKRWQLVGVVRAALRYLAREAPKDVLAWWKLAEILSQVGWHDMARSLPL